MRVTACQVIDQFWERNRKEPRWREMKMKIGRGKKSLVRTRTGQEEKGEAKHENRTEAV